MGQPILLIPVPCTINLENEMIVAYVDGAFYRQTRPIPVRGTRPWRRLVGRGDGVVSVVGLGDDFFGVDDLLAQWAEEDAMVRLWDEGGGVRVWQVGAPLPEGGRRTIVYRGCEIVHTMKGEWEVWYLAVSGREGRIGQTITEAAARRLVDACWDNEGEKPDA